MTHSDLETWRKRIPFFIVALCVLPYILIRSSSLEQAKLVYELIIPALALVAAFFYVGLDIRAQFWKREIDKHIGNQIRTALLDMIPVELQVTERERRDLAQREVFKGLTGVFWEAIDQDEVLRSHKQHFYSNGIVYTTSIDVFILCGIGGLCYLVGGIVTRNVILSYVGAGLIALAVGSKLFVTPRVRKRHLELSAEQLDLLRRRQRDFVSNRFREIVVEWRAARSVD
jgi:hypothetical protein